MNNIKLPIKIAEFFTAYYHTPLTKFELDAINFCVEAHGIDPEGEWMINLFDHLVGNRLGQKIELLKQSYPNGDNGFTNLMLDLKTNFNFDLGNYEDEGEYISWDLNSLNLSFFLSREGLPDFYIVEILKN